MSRGMSEPSQIIYKYQLIRRKIMRFLFILMGGLFVVPISYSIAFDQRAELWMVIGFSIILIGTSAGIIHSIIFIIRANIKVYSDRYERIYVTDKAMYDFDEIINMELFDKKTHSYIILHLQNGKEVKAATKVDRKPLKKLYEKWKGAWEAYKEDLSFEQG